MNSIPVSQQCEVDAKFKSLSCIFCVSDPSYPIPFPSYLIPYKALEPARKKERKSACKRKNLPPAGPDEGLVNLAADVLHSTPSQTFISSALTTLSIPVAVTVWDIFATSLRYNEARTICWSFSVTDGQVHQGQGGLTSSLNWGHILLWLRSLNSSSYLRVDGGRGNFAGEWSSRVAEFIDQTKSSAFSLGLKKSKHVF